GPDEGPGLYRIEVNEGPGSGVKLLNRPAPPPFVESLKCGEQNLYARARELVGDRDPRQHEFSVQLRAFDLVKGGRGPGPAARVAGRGGLGGKGMRGGRVSVGGAGLGGSVSPVHNAVSVVERGVEKGASLILMPVSARKQLFELSDDMATRIDVQFY